LLGLDPHTVYDIPNKPTNPINFPINNTTTTNNNNNNSNNIIYTEAFPSKEYISQIHVDQFVRLDFQYLDPSMAISFYFSDREEFEEFSVENKRYNEKLLKLGKFPLYCVEPSPPSFMNDMLWNEDNTDVYNNSTNNNKSSSNNKVKRSNEGISFADGEETDEYLDDEYEFV
jgi:hypothetical protein